MRRIASILFIIIDWKAAWTPFFFGLGLRAHQKRTVRQMIVAHRPASVLQLMGPSDWQDCAACQSYRNGP
jgi:hypothetical protein